MQQFAGRNDGVDVKLCPVVIEYLDSGRADTKANEHDKCTNAEVRPSEIDSNVESFSFLLDVQSVGSTTTSGSGVNHPLHTCVHV